MKVNMDYFLGLTNVTTPVYETITEDTMTFQQIASMIAKLEGKKSQSRIGDIREILKHLITLEAEGAGVLTDLLERAKAEIKRREKKRKNNVKI